MRREEEREDRRCVLDSKGRTLWGVEWAVGRETKTGGIECGSNVQSRCQPIMGGLLIYWLIFRDGTTIYPPRPAASRRFTLFFGTPRHTAKLARSNHSRARRFCDRCVTSSSNISLCPSRFPTRTPGPVDPRRDERLCISTERNKSMPLLLPRSVHQHSSHILCTSCLAISTRALFGVSRSLVKSSAFVEVYTF